MEVEERLFRVRDSQGRKMTISPVIPVFQCQRDIALKLFREAGRAWNASTLEEMGDHLFNFCVTNSSLRDWILQSKGEKGDEAFHSAWRATPS